jgi:hypothetical protein
MSITPINIGAAPNDGSGDTLRSAGGKINANFAGLAGGANVFNATLVAWAEAEAFEATSVTRDSDGVPSSAVVKWPDGSAGAFTRTAKDTTFLAVDAFTVSHTASGKTVTQASVTRDALGNITTKPALTVA